MGEVFAGFVCGYILALVGAPALAVGLMRLRTSSQVVARLLPENAPMAALMVVLHGGLMILFTGAGLILGLVLLAMGDSRGALGSPNIAFTLLVFGLTWAAFAPVLILLKRYRTQASAAALLVLLLFGWLMPHMAGWSKFSPS